MEDRNSKFINDEHVSNDEYIDNDEKASPLLSDEDDEYETERKRELEKFQKEVLPKAEMFSPEYFLYTCSGRYSSGISRSEIGVSLLAYTGSMQEQNAEQLENELNYREIATRLTKQGEISFVPTEEHVIVDIKFRTSLDPEFQLIWRQLEKYGEMLSQQNMDESSDYPLLLFTIVSDTYIDECYLTFSNPIFWVLQPPSTETSDCCMIRMLLSSECFNITQISEDIDLEQLEAESARAYNTILTEK